MNNHNSPTRLKSPPPPSKSPQLPLWDEKKTEVIQQIALQNRILIAEKIPDRLALGNERYYLDLRFRFSAQFYRGEIEAAIAATDEWRYPNLTELQAIVEHLCQRGVKS